MTRTLSRRRRRGNPFILLVPSVSLLIAAVGLFVWELVSFSQRETRLPDGLMVANVEVGGLDRNTAVAQWERAYAEPIIMWYGDNPIQLNPDTIGFRISSETMLAKALAASEDEGGFWIRFFNYLLGQENLQVSNVLLEADYQRNLLRQLLEDIAARYDRQGGEAQYDLQTLTIFTGNPGSALDVEEAIELVDSALRRPEDRIVQLPISDSRGSQPGLASLRQLIIDYLDLQNFIYDGQTTIASVFIMDLRTGEEINILSDVAFSAASTMKLPILVDYYRYLDAPPTQDEAWVMANSLLCSNNGSSNLLMRILGENDLSLGLASVSNTAQYLGARNTYISAPFIEVAGQAPLSIATPETNPNPNYDANADPFNQTTPEDLGTLLNLIYDCAQFGSGLINAYPDGQITQNECRQMLELTSANDLQRLLQGGIPEGVRISHKNGWVNDTVGEAGIVYSPNGNHYIISVFLWEQADFQNYEKLWPLVEEISRAAWNYFNPENPLLTPRNNLPRTAQECYIADASGQITEYVYLPPPEQLDLNNINGWREP